MADFRELSSNSHLYRHFFEFISSNLSELEFKRAFRMSRRSFRCLSAALALKLQKYDAQGASSSAGTIDVDCQLAMLSRTLVGAQYSSIMIFFGVSRPTIIRCLSDVSAAILDTLSLSRIPETEMAYSSVAAAFPTSRTSNNPIKFAWVP